MRKIIQICPDIAHNGIYALCDDGTLWVYRGVSWKIVPQDSLK